MKLIFLMFILTLFGCSLFADDFMKPTNYQIAERANVLETRKIPVNPVTRDAPEYEFITDPSTLVNNYYDYMPGSYNGTPVQIQADEFGGIYLIFHARETASATRRVYYTHIDAAGNTMTGTINWEDNHEGYAGIDIDPVSGDPIAAWHVNSDATGDLEVVASYDMYHISSGLWITSFDVITDNIPSPNGTLDEFIWPYANIGPSPIADKRRVYIQANNSYSSSDPSENPIIAYADFEQSDLGNTPSLVWSYFTIPVFDNWNLSNPEWIRPFHSFTVSEVDGTIAFFGYNSNDEVYVCYNDNYGEGDWNFESEDISINTWNPQNLDGSYAFEDNNGNPENLHWAPLFSGHMTSVFINGSNNLIMETNLGLYNNSDEYYPYETFPYFFKYDFNTNDFSFIIANPIINENTPNPNYE